MLDEAPIILLSGMGADARIFAPQLRAFPALRVPEWIPPRGDESLVAYAERFARAIDPGRPFYLGGMSFGGMLAVEMLHHLPVRRCFLISSVRSRGELPRRLRAFEMAGKHPMLASAWMTTRIAKAGLKLGGHRLPAARRAYFEQVAASDPAFLKWAVRAMYTWRSPARAAKVPIHHIHGGRDPILPARWTRPDHVIEDAGHVLTLSHPEVLNQFIRRFIEEDARAL